MTKVKKANKIARPIKTQETQVVLNMTYTEAMKKALNTPLPKKDKVKRA